EEVDGGAPAFLAVVGEPAGERFGVDLLDENAGIRGGEPGQPLGELGLQPRAHRVCLADQSCARNQSGGCPSGAATVSQPGPARTSPVDQCRQRPRGKYMRRVVAPFAITGAASRSGPSRYSSSMASVSGSSGYARYRCRITGKPLCEASRAAATMA